MFHTSILDRLTGPLYDALSGGDGDATAPAMSEHEGLALRVQEILHMLERWNVFIVRLDDERRWCL